MTDKVIAEVADVLTTNVVVFVASIWYVYDAITVGLIPVREAPIFLYRLYQMFNIG